MTRDSLVYWSVFEANRRRGPGPRSRGMQCPECGADAWYIRNGVDERYKSKWNPGEYVEYTCSTCGYGFEVPS